MTRELDGKAMREQAGSALATLAVLLIVAWFFREILQISMYSKEIVLAALGLYFASRLLAIDIEFGFRWLIVSLLGSLAKFAFIGGLMLYLLGFFGLETMLTEKALPLIIISILLGIGSLAFAKSVGVSKYRVTLNLDSKPRLFKEGLNIGYKDLKVELDKDAIGFRVRLGSSIIGAILFENLTCTIQSLLGPIRIKFKPPIFIRSYKFASKSDKVSESKVRELTGLDLKELRREAERVLDNVRHLKIKWGDLVKLPFVKIEERDEGDIIKVGPLSIYETEDRDIIEIPPFVKIESHHKASKSRMRIYGFGKPKAMLIATSRYIRAKWDGFKLKSSDEITVLKTDEEEAGSTKNAIFLRSPNYSLRVSKSSASLYLPDAKLLVKEDGVYLNYKNTIYTSRDIELSLKLFKTLTEEAKRQIERLLAGEPSDPLELLEILDNALKDLEEE